MVLTITTVLLWENSPITRAMNIHSVLVKTSIGPTQDRREDEAALQAAPESDEVPLLVPTDTKAALAPLKTVDRHMVIATPKA